MPNTKSAEKRARQSIKRRANNRAVLSRVRTERRKAFAAVVKDADPAVATKALADYASTLDKAAKRGIIKRNTADRRKSRMAKRLAALTK